MSSLNNERGKLSSRSEMLNNDENYVWLVGSGEWERAEPAMYTPQSVGFTT